jgi:hypothetical protein
MPCKRKSRRKAKSIKSRPKVVPDRPACKCLDGKSYRGRKGGMFVAVQRVYRTKRKGDQFYCSWVKLDDARLKARFAKKYERPAIFSDVTANGPKPKKYQDGDVLFVGSEYPQRQEYGLVMAENGTANEEILYFGEWMFDFAFSPNPTREANLRRVLETQYRKIFNARSPDYTNATRKLLAFAKKNWTWRV